jgi:hypothetical protein
MSTETDDFLAHYGVKGMKWGKRKAARLERNREILSARGRQVEREDKYEQSVVDYFNAKTRSGKAKAERAMAENEKKLINSPDAAMAAKLTSGEKWANGAAWASAGIATATYAALIVTSNKR